MRHDRCSLPVHLAREPSYIGKKNELSREREEIDRRRIFVGPRESGRKNGRKIADCSKQLLKEGRSARNSSRGAFETTSGVIRPGKRDRIKRRPLVRKSASRNFSCGSTSYEAHVRGRSALKSGFKSDLKIR